MPSLTGLFRELTPNLSWTEARPGIHGFKPTWPCQIVEAFATRATFLQPSGYYKVVIPYVGRLLYPVGHGNILVGHALFLDQVNEKVRIKYFSGVLNRCMAPNRLGTTLLLSDHLRLLHARNKYFLFTPEEFRK